MYFSRTNNIESLVQKLDIPLNRKLKIEDPEIVINEKFVLLTYTDLLGQIPESVSIFLEKNHSNLVGVAGSGNRNFGTNFCGSAKQISKKYGVPLLETFELSGDSESIEKFKDKLIRGDY